MSEWITPAEVTEWSREPATKNLTSVVDAVNAFVTGLPVAAGVDELPPAARLGAIMLAARLARRRNSANGIESATDIGVTYTARYDADISRLLQLDGLARPAVG